MTTVNSDVMVLVRPLLPPLEQLSAALSAVLRSGVLTNDGPRVQALEALLSDAIGVTDLAICASGTTAVQLACSALGTEGEVIVPAAAFPAAALAIMRAGGRPVGVDIEPTYLTVDPAAVQAAITPQTRAIMAVHFFGCPADVDALQEIARAAGVPLILDAATCWGVSYRGRPLLSYGYVSTLSLHATKLMHSVEGGAVIGNSQPIAERVRLLRNFGSSPSGVSRDGTNARMSELHAAIGAVVLGEAAAEIARRVAVRAWYAEALRDIPWLSLYEFRPEAGPNVAALPVRLAPDAGFDAEEFAAELARYRIHARAYFAGRYRLDGIPTVGPTPHAAEAAKRILCLPFWGGLTEADIARVVDALRAVRTGTRTTIGAS
jgi:dTDP-4-amino-4,6-dideoxygalactose transaminase